MIKPRMIIGPVLDRGPLGLSKNLKTFTLNRKLREEIGLEKHHLSKNADLDKFRASNSCTSNIAN